MKTTKLVSTKKSSFLILGLFFSLFFTSNMKAQEIKIEGIIKGKNFEKTETLNGANIFLQGSKTGTTSNKKGVFTFPKKLKIGDILVFSYLGYVTKKIKITKNSTFLNITLTEDENQMLGAINTNKRYKSKRN
ncbi:carboxypeptidase-like regulatory domain-containing protein [uncultured Polaribacter sp.]|uniref:carboxypeptidase-like regulatory domain-containing protein n=1 Tax=uncultured Polaribacter sp. TaxID=174711 RepID=UPI002604F613|nr:carboxypeptidase-like regulatory domain-containing protein [uncultured Polaribacter sp.]